MKKVIIIGGDDRLKTVEKHLRDNGFSVSTLGLYQNDSGDISSADIIILPVPTTKDKATVFTPLTGRRIPLSEIKERLTPEKTVLCCNYYFENCNCTDYNKLDSYALLNAVPTAEGAIKLCIENTPFTLWDARVLVIGCGRVGKVLANRLRGLGANVTVSARKLSDFALIKAIGFNAVNTNLLNDRPLEFDVIFNTVDFYVLNNESFENTPCKCIIDLSSKGGFSIDAAKKCGITAIKAPGLPGITAPHTAGKILAETVIKLIVSNQE